MEIAIKIAQLLLSLSILVVLHELGHFIPAKLFKTRVEKFFLFFDVKFALFQKKIGETIYGIGWLPLGGYVKIAGMIDESMDKEQLAKPAEPWEFRSKPAWQRLIIMLGGVIVNVIVGMFIYIMIIYFWGTNSVLEKDIPKGYSITKTMRSYGFQNGDIPLKINGEHLENTLEVNRFLLLRDVKNITVKHADGQIETLSVPDTIGKQLFRNGEMEAFIRVNEIVLDVVAPDSPMSKAGILKGDKLLEINSFPVPYYGNLTDAVAKITDLENVIVKVLRDGKELDFKLKLGADKKFGFAPKLNDKSTHRSYSFGESIVRGIRFGYWILHDYAAQFKFVFTKKGVSELGGIGSMMKMFDAQWNWVRFWESTAMISIILAFMNILPIPALDGGHTVFLLYEMVTGRKPNDKILEYAQIIGIVILLTLMVYANGNDIYKAIFPQK